VQLAAPDNSLAVRHDTEHGAHEATTPDRAVLTTINLANSAVDPPETTNPSATSTFPPTTLTLYSHYPLHTLLHPYSPTFQQRPPQTKID
jgi:hypothetical protein